MEREKEIVFAWFAGLSDGEGCFNVSYRERNAAMECKFVINMAHKETIDKAAVIMREFSNDICTVRELPKKVDPRGYTTRQMQWTVRTTTKQGALHLCEALEPYLVTKKLECCLCLVYLRRAVSASKYHATGFDRYVVDIIRALKHDPGEAPIIMANDVLNGVVKEEHPHESTFTYYSHYPKDFYQKYPMGWWEGRRKIPSEE